mmetsp:Transcript_17534/g.50190  ORF Transcript_17534/g.50190 Transcript_17534/m.50190 type:complete len:230 (+) Transcript_17534:3460-4149(+)
MQVATDSSLMNPPMAQRRASFLAQAAVAFPKDLARLGKSSKARWRDNGEWLGEEIVANIRKMCLSRAEWRLWRTSSWSEEPVIGEERLATSRSFSMASASAVNASSEPGSKSFTLDRASIYPFNAVCRFDFCTRRPSSCRSASTSWDPSSCRQESRIMEKPTARLVGVRTFFLLPLESLSSVDLYGPRITSSMIWFTRSRIPESFPSVKNPLLKMRPGIHLYLSLISYE